MPLKPLKRGIRRLSRSDIDQIVSSFHGTAAWQTEEGRFEIGPDSCLVFNDRQPYSITVEPKRMVETLCIFFAAGFVEDIHRGRTSSDLALLDEPANHRRLEFGQRLRKNDRVLTPLLRRVLVAPGEEGVLRLAEALVKLHENAITQASKLPAVKVSTRVELLRRVHRSRNVIEGSLFQPLWWSTSLARRHSRHIISIESSLAFFARRPMHTSRGAEWSKLRNF